MRLRPTLGLTAVALLWGTSAAAQQLVYTPINPTFGGNPFNSSHLLAVAGAQNRFTAPTTSQTANPSQGDVFAQQLQSILLSRLAQQISDAIFGQNPQQNGTVTFGTQTISFNRTLTGVNLSITDTSTGQVTNVSVPTLQSTSTGATTTGG
jgi:curli production assembly/transport component CsgF